MLVLMAATYAGTYYPETLRATVAYQDARSAERSRDFERAIQEYDTVLVTYPDSRLALAHLGISYYRSGNIYEAIWILGRLWGRDNPKEVASQVNNILKEIKQRDGVK